MAVVTQFQLIQVYTVLFLRKLLICYEPLQITLMYLTYFDSATINENVLSKSPLQLNTFYVFIDDVTQEVNMRDFREFKMVPTPFKAI